MNRLNYEKVIQTDWLKWGLSDEDVEQAIHILNDTAA